MSTKTRIIINRNDVIEWLLNGGEVSLDDAEDMADLYADTLGRLTGHTVELGMPRGGEPFQIIGCAEETPEYDEARWDYEAAACDLAADDSWMYE